MKHVRVFFASPGGLAQERSAFREEVLAFNDDAAVPRGFYFQPVGWEDTLSDVDRPQSIINEEIRTSHYCFVTFFERWGTPPSSGATSYSSGTEEEYYLALECHRATPPTMRHVALFFKGVDPIKLQSPDSQLQAVLAFKKRIEDERSHKYIEFDSLESFRRLVRKHLHAWLTEAETGANPPEITSAQTTTHQQRTPILDPPEAPSLPEARTETVMHAAAVLFGEGRVVEAELEFARALNTTSDPHLLLAYADFLEQVGRLSQAIEVVKRSIGMAQLARNSHAAGDARVRLGYLLLDQGDLAASQVALEDALAAFRDANQPEQLARTYLALGFVLKARGQPTTAGHMYDKALEIYTARGARLGIASTFGCQSQLLDALGDTSAALDLANKALVIYQELGSEQGLAAAYANTAALLDASGKVAQAQELGQKALAIHMRTGNSLAVAADHETLSIIARHQGNLDLAERHVRAALEINNRIGNLGGVSIDYGNLGNCYLARRDYENAAKMFSRVLELDSSRGNSDGVAAAKLNLGVVKKEQGDLPGAEALFRESLTIYQRSGNLDGMASVYGNLGVIHQNKGEYVQAEEMATASLAIHEKHGHPREVFRALLNFGVLEQRRQNAAKAESYFRRGLEVAKSHNWLQGIGDALFNLGTVFDNSNNVEAAIECYEKALNVAVTTPLSVPPNEITERLELLRRRE